MRRYRYAAVTWRKSSSTGGSAKHADRDPKASPFRSYRFNHARKVVQWTFHNSDRLANSKERLWPRRYHTGFDMLQNFLQLRGRNKRRCRIQFTDETNHLWESMDEASHLFVERHLHQDISREESPLDGLPLAAHEIEPFLGRDDDLTKCVC